MNSTVYYIDERKHSASQELAHFLRICIANVCRPWNELVFLCIGSDRVTGDSLGPFIGYQLEKHAPRSFSVYGTLEDPVHALNLAEVLDKIKRKHPRALIVAVDASLGSRKHLGFISVGTGSIRPGAGVKKELPDIGDVFITGIVNLSGSFEHLLLSTTRLSLVVSMADAITAGILQIFPERLRGTQTRPVLIPHTPEPEGRRLCCANDCACAALREEDSSSKGSEIAF